MNIEVRQPARAQKTRQGTRYGIVDCDIHPKLLIEDYRRASLAIGGGRICRPTGCARATASPRRYPMPKITPQAARRDAWPPGGGLPGSDLDFMREQLLDLYDMDYGILNPLQPTAQGDQNSEFSAAIAFAANEQQIDTVDLGQDKRLKASVVVPYENPEACKSRDQAPCWWEVISRRCLCQPHRRSAWTPALLADL